MEKQQCVSFVLFAYARHCQQYTVKPVQVSHLSFHSKSPSLYRWPAYGNHLTLRTFELCTITLVTVQFRVQTGGRGGNQVRNPVDELETCGTVMGQSLLENSGLLLSTLVEKKKKEVEWAWGVTAIQIFRSADTGRMNIKYNISGAERPGREVHHSGV